MKMNEYKVGERASDGSILTILNVEDIFPFFSNPVKWCDPAKLMRLKQEVEKGIKLPPITVVQEDDLLIVYNGHHRWFASYLAGEKQILAWLT